MPLINLYKVHVIKEFSELKFCKLTIANLATQVIAWLHDSNEQLGEKLAMIGHLRYAFSSSLSHLSLSPMQLGRDASSLQKLYFCRHIMRISLLNSCTTLKVPRSQSMREKLELSDPLFDNELSFWHLIFSVKSNTDKPEIGVCHGVPGCTKVYWKSL